MVEVLDNLFTEVDQIGHELVQQPSAGSVVLAIVSEERIEFLLY